MRELDTWRPPLMAARLCEVMLRFIVWVRSDISHPDFQLQNL